MPQESIVSPSPVGVARVVHFWHPENGTEYSAFYEKPTPVAVTGSLGWSQTGKDGLGIVAAGDRLFIRVGQINGLWQRYLNMQGSVGYRPRMSLTTVRPLAEFTRSIGRYVWETLAHWDAAPGAGVDSGIGFCPVDHGRIVAGSRQDDGLLIGNVAGVLKLVTRGPGGYEEVDLSAFANPLTDWNRIGLVLRHATKSADASVTAMVNGQPAAVRTWAAGHKLPVMPAANASWLPAQTHAEVATYLKTANLQFYAGPDVETL